MHGTESAGHGLLDLPSTATRRSSSAITDESDDSLEDYDQLELDPDTLVANTRKSLDSNYRPGFEETPPVGNGRVRREMDELSNLKNRNTIQIKLEKTSKKGRYVLTADDPQIKEVLRKVAEKEEEAASGKKKSRVQFRDLIFTRQFTTFDRQNPTSSESPFFGFFTLFWICMVLIFIQVAMRNYRDYGSILGPNQVLRLMFSHDVFVLAISDAVMCIATLESLLFQKLVFSGYISWAHSGWILQNVWQCVYLGSVVGWAIFRDWPWTHTVFAVLHGLVFLMKQHSHAFYNGYLSGVYRRRELLRRKLKQLEAMEPIASAPTSPLETQRTFSSSFSLAELNNKLEGSQSSNKSPPERRLSMGPRTSVNLDTEKSDVAQIAAAIESGQAINIDQMHTFSSIIKLEIDDLTKELQGKSENGKNAYPNNLKLANYAEYICLPTLVYELEYPRQEKTNWWYVLEKTTATFGVLCVMQVISQGHIYPLVAKTNAMKDAGMTLEERWREFPFIVSDLLFPLLVEQLLTWYLIWECILNVVAEVTRFADRGFYGPWYNAVTWDQYARDWNRPVHSFLLRHVYHSSISTFHLSRSSATFVTFLLSALVHEMVMALIFRKIRFYLFWLQLFQVPLVVISRSKLLRDRVVLGNVIFWVGLFIGPSVLTSLYLVV